MTRRSPLHPHWFGYLALDNYEEVAEHVRQMLEGKRYAFASNMDGHPGMSDLRVSQKLDAPIRVTMADGFASICMSDGNYAWGLHTSLATEREASDDRTANGRLWTHVKFSDDYRGERLTIEQLNGYGELLTWIVVVEDECRDCAERVEAAAVTS